MKRIARYVAVLLWLPALPLAAAELIESFHSEIRVERNGDLVVTENIRVKAEGRVIRRGIYRDFPTRFRDARGHTVVVDFEVLGVRRDGRPEPFHVENRGNGKRVYIGDRNVFLAPDYYDYELTYRTTRQLGFFADFDELYWNVTGTGWIFPIEHASARVVLPADASELRLTGYTGPEGSTEQALTHRRVGSHEAYFETTAPLGRREGLTIVAAFAKGIVVEPGAAQRRAWFWRDNRAAILATGGALVLLLYYLLLWHRVGRDPAAGVILPRYRPPEGYSPASMRYVQNMGYDKRCFTAATVNLAVKGALEIVDDDGDFELLRSEASPREPLAAGESQVLEGLFADDRGSLSVVQSNHDILRRAIGKHKKSLKLDYEKRYFKTNSWLLTPGIFATLLVSGAAFASLDSERAMAETGFVAFFALMPLLMLLAAYRGLRIGGLRGKVQLLSNFAALLFFGGFFMAVDFPFEQFVQTVPWYMVGGIVAMVVLHYLFYQWLKAPTLAGRRLLDQIEGFRHYLEVAEGDEIALKNAPSFTQDIYERYLPYAIALDLENAWTDKLDRAIASGLVDSAYRAPRWYHSPNRVGGRDFGRSLSGAFNSAIASASVAPGSSSGSSGGFSGGGGGGGGGGGW